jgi:hypothetical protein
LEALNSIADRRSKPLRRFAPYNEWGIEGKFAPRRYLVGDVRRDGAGPNP